MRRALLGGLVTLAVSPASAGIIDSINPNASPATIPGETVQFLRPGNNIGWVYTPPVSFSLDGIFSNFEAFSGTRTTPTLTVQIQTDRPAVGGVLLREASFQGDSAKGGILGGNFEPLQLTAGTPYFVDFLNINGMGIDLGTWQTVNGVPQPAGGATTNLGAFYQDSASTKGFAVAVTSNLYTYSNDGTVPISGAEPILYFSGTLPIPEPSSLLLAALGTLGLSILASRRRAGL